MAKLRNDKPDMRVKVVDMLMADRKAALAERNSGAAVTASTRIADLLLRKDEDGADEPVTQVAITVVHQVICPVCKEAGPILAAPPEMPEDMSFPPRRRASAWDEGDEE